MIVCPWGSCRGCLDLDRSPIHLVHAYDVAIVRAGPLPARWRFFARWLWRRRVRVTFERVMGWRR